MPESFFGCRRSSQRWLIVAAASVFAALTATAAQATAPRGAAAAASPRLTEAVTLTCDGPSARGVVDVVAPRNCSILYPSFSLLGGVQMQDLHWTGWGSGVATATGISHGFHDGAAYRIQVRVYRLLPAGCHRSGEWYTRLSVKSAGYGWSKPINTGYC